MLVLIKTLLFLIFIILLVYGCFYIAKKRALFLSDSRIKVIEHKRIDQKISISLICVDGIEMVIVAGPQGTTIKKLRRRTEIFRNSDDFRLTTASSKTNVVA